MICVYMAHVRNNGNTFKLLQIRLLKVFITLKNVKFNLNLIYKQPLFVIKESPYTVYILS